MTATPVRALVVGLGVVLSVLGAFVSAAIAAPGAADTTVPDSVSCDQVLSMTPSEWEQSLADDCPLCLDARAETWTTCRRVETLASLTDDAARVSWFTWLERNVRSMADQVTELNGIQMGGNGYFRVGVRRFPYVEQRLATLAEMVRSGDSRETSPSVLERIKTLRLRIEKRLAAPSVQDVEGPDGGHTGSPDTSYWAPIWREHARSFLLSLKTLTGTHTLLSGGDRGTWDLLTILDEWIDERLLTQEEISRNQFSTPALDAPYPKRHPY